MSVNIFDAGYYASVNPDLAQNGVITNEQLQAHLLNSGLNEGRAFSPFVDLNFYRSSYSDLAQNGVTTNRAAFDHLQNNGVAEGRRFSPFVDINHYLNAHTDLRQAFGSDLEQAFGHLTTGGVTEPRQFSVSFDPAYYRSIHPNDLGQLNWNNVNLLEHFKGSGLNEGRASSQFLDIKYYLNNSPDLQALGFDFQRAYYHFVSSGFAEGRYGTPNGYPSVVRDFRLGTAVQAADQTDAENYLKQGYTYITNGNVQAAFESYNKALSINSNYADAYYGRGYAQHDLGHYQEAIEDYSQAIHINPNHGDAHLNRGFTRSVIGDTQGAVKDAEKAAEIFLKQSDIDRYNRAKDFIAHNKALKAVYGESLNMQAQLQLEAEQLYSTGNIFASSGNFQQALNSYDQAIALDKSNPMYFNNRASTLKRLGRMQDALAQYHELVKLHPSYGKAYLSMASTHIELNAYLEAVNSYKKFLSAYESDEFSFNPILGGVNQAVKGQSELETILFTSINYLLLEQQEKAIKAFNEAMSPFMAIHELTCQ